MSLFSPMTWFCCCCGQRQESAPANTPYAQRRVCSKECNDELRWRETLSMLGKGYRPQDAEEQSEART